MDIDRHRVCLNIEMIFFLTEAQNRHKIIEMSKNNFGVVNVLEPFGCPFREMKPS